MINLRRLLLGLIVSLHAGCSKMHSNANTEPFAGQSLGTDPSAGKTPVVVTPPLPPTSSTSPIKFPKVSLCSGLDFSGITWSSSLSAGEQTALALALNVSGSFEGPRQGWATLSTSFDGQGLSMGLLNQNLGQGTLEPMLVDMHTLNAPTMRGIFSAGNIKSMMTMLSQWKGVVIPATIHLLDYGYSALDDINIVAAEIGVEPAELENIQVALTSRNQLAVNWALSTIYKGSSFKSDWSTQLKALAVTPTYRSLQVGQAEKIHRVAMEMFYAFKMHELRSYLFFFDVAVQNGGISSPIRQDFNSWLKSNPKASESEKLKQILALRLRSVSKRFISDVRSRKAALIKGSGVVHGQANNFEKDYCVSLSTRLAP